MTPVTVGLASVVVEADMSVDLVGVEDDVTVSKVLVLELGAEMEGTGNYTRARCGNWAYREGCMHRGGGCGHGL
jgi:hypothetical protein